jgi:hypothetical protein
MIYLHVTVVDGSIPSEERKNPDDWYIPAARMRDDLRERNTGTYVILAARSRAPSLEPETRMKMQATMLMIRVSAKTSHSWNMRVMRGREASGISSVMSW